MPQTRWMICFRQLSVEMILGVRVALAKESLVSVIKYVPEPLPSPRAPQPPDCSRLQWSSRCGFWVLTREALRLGQARLYCLHFIGEQLDLLSPGDMSAAPNSALPMSRAE